MSEETPESAGEEKSAVRLTEAQWAEIKADYELGKATKSDLARKYGVTRQSIGKGLDARGAIYGSKSKAIENARLESEVDSARQKVAAIEDFKAKQLTMVTNLQNLALKVLGEKLKAGRPVSDAKTEINTIRSAMAILKMGRDEVYHLYDLYRDPDGAEENEELIISEYSPDEIEAINNSRFGHVESLEDVVGTLSNEIDDAESIVDNILGDDA